MRGNIWKGYRMKDIRSAGCRHESAVENMERKIMKTETFIARTTCPNTVVGRLRTPCAARMLPLLLLLLALPAAVQAQDYTYTTNNNTITITGYAGSGGAVTIPGTINNLPVTSIGDGAFAFNTIITSATIPDSVTSIGEGAFEYSSGLASVTIDANVTSIGNKAFYDCTGLTSITIPNNVTSIAD